MAAHARVIGPLTRLVAKEIRRIRRGDTDMTQQDLADAAAIPRNSLSQMENASMIIDLDQLGRIAGAFGLAPHEVLERALANASRDELVELISSGAVVLPVSTADRAEIRRATHPERYRAQR